MADGNGETKKPGLFGRMFGRGKAEAETAPVSSNESVIARSETTKQFGVRP